MGSGLRWEGEIRYDRAHERRLALGRILRPRARGILDNTVGHAVRATNFLGLGRAAARCYAAVAERSLPSCLAALEAADARRPELLEECSAFMRELFAAGFSRYAQKPLVSLGFRLAQREVRAHAGAQGYDSDELEDELRVFQRAFEARLIYR